MTFQEPVTTLPALAYCHLSDFLESNGCPPSKRADLGLSLLLETFDRALRGRLSPKYYLASFDPGSGKSCAVAAFLRAWKEQRYEPEGSILIGLSRLDEIERMVLYAGLPKEDFGVFTTSDPHNSLGVPKAELGSARVLFTTQQMIVSRTKKRSFEEASEFHFQGRPRSLRIWDESLEPASSLVISKDDLSLLHGLRFQHPSYVKMVERLTESLGLSENGRILNVPPELASVPVFDPLELPRGAEEVAHKLASVAGQEMIVIDDGLGGKSLVGTGSELSKDFAPVVILDASGRVRTTYDLWSKHRGGLEPLPPVPNDYRRLTVHLWKRRSGRQVLRDPKVRSKIASAIAEEINKDESSRWLIAHSKHDRETVADIKALVTHNPDQRIATMTWGNHHGTNVFRDVENVVLIGQLTMRRSQYMGKLLAASGLPVREARRLDIDELRWGEYRHNLLQAACRGAVRRSERGVAGKCRLFLVTSPSPHLERLIEETFPGCRIEQWRPGHLALKGRARQVADFLLACFEATDNAPIRKGEVSSALGMPPPNLSRIIKQPAFAEFMDSEGIWTSTQWFYRDDRPDYENSAFDEVPGGYVYEEGSEPQEPPKPSIGDLTQS